MQKSITELKIKAKKLQRQLAISGTSQTLTGCQQQIAREAGFNHWHHASEVLSGSGKITQGYGTLWYHPKCATLLNIWFANYGEAKEALQMEPRKILVPYKTQFVLVTKEYLTTLGVADKHFDELLKCGGDLLTIYGSELFDVIAMYCIEKRFTC